VVFEYDELVSMLLRDVGCVLLSIYQVYFEHELKSSSGMTEATIVKTSQKNLFNLLKDFEICPGILTKQQATRLYADESRPVPFYKSTGLEILNKARKKDLRTTQPLYQAERQEKQVGKCFTFFRLLDLLVESAVQAFSDPFFNQGGTMSLAEMMCLLLERMELSQGFTLIERKMSRTHTSQHTLLPSKTVVKRIKAAKETLFQVQALDEYQSNNSIQRQLGQLEAKEKEIREAYNTVSGPQKGKRRQPEVSSQERSLRVGLDCFGINEMNGTELLAGLDLDQKEILEHVFTYYCSFGDPMNAQRLKSSKFIKFLRDSGLLKQGVLQNHELKAQRENDPNQKAEFK